MAAITVRLTVRLRWWVWPYLRSAEAFLWLMQPFVDDAELQQFVDSVSHTIAQYGLVAELAPGDGNG